LWAKRSAKELSHVDPWVLAGGRGLPTNAIMRHARLRQVGRARGRLHCTTRGTTKVAPSSCSCCGAVACAGSGTPTGGMIMMLSCVCVVRFWLRGVNLGVGGIRGPGCSAAACAYVRLGDSELRRLSARRYRKTSQHATRRPGAVQVAGAAAPGALGCFALWRSFFSSSRR